MRKFDIQPRVAGSVTVGSNKRKNRILAARMTERGPAEPIYFDGSDDFVVLQVGKRGSGKSYGLGSILEGFATGTGSRIGTHTEPRAVVLLDPLDVHWPALIPLRADGPAALTRQYNVLRQWEDLVPEPIDVRVFVPAGYDWPIDHPGFCSYQLPVSEMTGADWGLLLDTDLVLQPRGRLIDEAYRKVVQLGWQHVDTGEVVAPHAEYGIADLIACIEHDQEIDQAYATETIRSVVQPLRAYARMPLFGATNGTAMTAIAQAGVLSILSLGRLPEDLRTVVATVFVRRLKSDRMYASQISRRLALSPDDEATRARLVEALHGHVPRTILAIDEAQILMPAKTNSLARRTLDSYVLEGRNFGLSLWLATQRPKGAISDAAISQVDTFFVHKLSVSEDIAAVCGMLQNKQPDSIKLDQQEIEVADLIRNLDTGQVLVSSATSDAKRLVVGEIRPRMVAHGGEAF